MSEGNYVALCIGTAGNIIFIILGLAVIKKWLLSTDTSMSAKLNQAMDFFSKHCATIHVGVEKEMSAMKRDIEIIEEREGVNKETLYHAIDAHGHKGLRGDDNAVIREAR